MHELGITRNLVALVGEAAAGRRVRKVWLEIGTRTALLPDAVRFCFDVVAKGTPLQDSTLEIIELQPGWHCPACGAGGVDLPGADRAHGDRASGDSTETTCPQCGSTGVLRRSGDELNIKAMEVEPCA